ncbi:MAG TPA: peptidylprolyl isomerase [Pelomicrobium sp.]|nr:peptidylprolyl isomerase [Pelomicrobium sp.]
MKLDKRLTRPLLRSLLALALALAAIAPGAAQRIVPLDRIVAVVNQEVITQDELDQRVALIRRQLAGRGGTPPDAEALRRQVLERMIVERAQLQYARETGLRVDDAQVDQAIQRIAQQNNLTAAQFRQVLQRDGVPYEQFREQLRKELVLSRLREREIEGRVTVSEAEIENFLSTQQTQGAGGDGEFLVSHILVRVSEGATGAEIDARRRRAEAALAELRGGADFARVAAVYSDAPDALQGGSLGWRPPTRLPELFAQTVSGMRPGDVSNVLRSPGGFHIVKLVEQRGAKTSAQVTQTRVRHILIKPSELLPDSEARERVAQVRERIANGADFAELARLYSEDLSASRGGELGWVNPGDTVPEFERAMDALKPGELSPPVKSPFGWHLIQVEERRVGDVSAERERVLAREAVRARKAEQAYDEWVRQLRDQAYVEYRLES